MHLLMEIDFFKLHLRFTHSESTDVLVHIKFMDPKKKKKSNAGKNFSGNP